MLVHIRRESLNVHQLGARLRIVVTPFERESIGDNQQLSHGFEGLLLPAILKHRRFSLVERSRLKEVLEELKLSESGLVDEDTALKVGKLLAAGGTLLGSVLERADSVEIYARLVDTETAEVLTAVDIYGENVDIGLLRTLSRGLNLKLAKELPVAEGIVMKTDHRRITVNFGRNKGVKKGMKLILYQIGEVIRDPETGEPAGLEVEELGQARIESVTEDISFADLDYPSAVPISGRCVRRGIITLTSLFSFVKSLRHRQR